MYVHLFFWLCIIIDVVIFFLSVSIEVQRWHGGHYMVSGGNDGLGHLNVINLYLFFSQCFGNMTNDNNEHLHYVFEERHTVEPVKYYIECELFLS